MCAYGIIRESNKTVLGLSFWFLFWNFNTHRQTTRIWVEPHERQIPSLGMLFQVTIPLERLVGYREISGKHLHFCRGPVNSLLSSTSSGVTAQNILISRVSIQERYLLSHSGISPLATIRTFRINKLNPKGLSWRPYFVQFWCGRAICRRQMIKTKQKKQVDEKVNMYQIPQSIVVASARHCGCQRKTLWLKPNLDFSSVRLWTAASLAAQKKKTEFF